MDLTNQQLIFDTIKKADNAQLWSTCGVIARSAEKAAKLLAQATQREESYREEQAKEKENGLNPNRIDVSTLTDAELRLRVKQHLVDKLTNNTLGAADIGQLKDVFGLASKTEDLTIQVVDYTNAIIDCPHCNANIHKASTIAPSV